MLLGALQHLVGALQHLALSAGVLAIGVCVSLEYGPRLHPFEAVQDASAAKPSSAMAPVWAVDIDGDGVNDLANPTHAGIRGIDTYGSGKFGARRDRGRRKHEGADLMVAAGATVWSPLSGVVTDIGHAYADDAELRFVEIRDKAHATSARVFYVDPTVQVGQVVKAGEGIGVAESLAARYPRGITNHVHLELRDAAGKLIDPADVLPFGAPPRTLRRSRRARVLGLARPH
jgi:murein DD-endopeptidase MepM/ murein hydrolase activator NlpD